MHELALLVDLHVVGRCDGDEHEARQMMRADEDRIDMQSERQRQHGVHRARRECDHDVGEPDGQFGIKTRSAIRDFQAKNGRIPDGFASAGILDQLRAH